jgi:DNA-binding SARP family transcriptional activator
LSRITVSLLGNPQLERDGEPIPIDRHKALALLAYLAITAQTHRRDALATLFWQEFDQTRARAALRRALASLNKAIPGAWWETDRETIGLNLKTSSHFLLDIAQFHTRLKDCQTHGHPITDVCPLCLAPLTEAVTLYRGDFLSGFTLRDSPAFDDWQFNQTEILRRDLASALERLSRLHATRGEFESATAHARRWLSLDSLNESAHRQLMLLHAQAGQRHAALRQYAECVRALERDVGVPPQDETTQLYEAIKVDALPPLSYPTSVPTTQTDSPPQATPPSQNQISSSPFERLVRGQIVGREDELTKVSEIWKRVSAGEARALLVSGEPGIGKTRLAREIVTLTKTSGAEVLSGECHAEDGAPYAPIIQIIHNTLASHETLPLSENILADLIKLVPELASQFPHMLPANPALDVQSEQRRLFDSVTSFIASFAQTTQSPLVVFIEDAHWADTGTLSLLRHLAQRASATHLKLLLLITYRDAEADLDEAHKLRDVLLDLNREHLSDSVHLTRLDREATSDMLSTMLGSEGGISSDFLNAIFNETEGNPFFIEETCRALIETGNLYYAGGHWRRADVQDFSLPPTVRGAILSRVQKLPQEVQELLRLAAIHGREFEAEILLGSGESGQTSMIEALELAQRAQLIVKSEREGRFAFTHALVPFALRESLSGLRRQRLHARAAESIESKSPDDVEIIAYHYAAAGVNIKAIEYSNLAAERAEKVYAYDSAIRHKQTALDMLDAREIKTRLTLLEELADLHFKLDQNARAIPIYLEALQLWRGLADADNWIAVRLQRKIGEATTSMNQFADYQRFAGTSRFSLEAGLALVQNQAPRPETIRLLRTLSRDAWYIVSSADWDAAERYARSAVKMAEELNLPVELSSALESLSIVHGARGQFRERVEVCRRRLELSRDLRFTDYRERVNVAYQLGRALLSVGEYEAALIHAKEAEELSAAIQDVTTQVNAMTLQSQCLHPLDRWDDLLAMDERLRHIQSHYTFERLGIAMCFHTALVSAVRTLRGEREQADNLREEAYTMMTKIVGPPERWVRNQRY